jgi:uncharacterized membrane protein YhaH (DUF805 family)
MSISARGASKRRAAAAAVDSVRRMILATNVLIIVQTGIGMVVNLYAAIPLNHPGAGASEYFTGSFHSVAWAISHGTAALAIHATLGLALAVLVVGVAVRASRLRRRAVSAWSILAALLVLGAGFNGASFLDYNHTISSLLMALFALSSLCCYSVVIYLLSSTASESHDGAGRVPAGR